MTEANGSEALSTLTLERARALLQQHIARVNAELYQIGRILNDVVDRKLTGAGSYDGALKHLGPAVNSLSENDLRRAAATARRFSEETGVKYGVRRLGLLVLYGRRIKQEWAGVELGPILVPVLCENGAVKHKPFAECTPEELGRALGSVGRARPATASRLEEYCVHLLREGIRKRFTEDFPMTVKAFTRAGRMCVTLNAVPVVELKMLAGAIRESLVPLERRLHQQPSAVRSV